MRSHNPVLYTQTFLLTCAHGLEPSIELEVAQLGAKVIDTQIGRITIEGTLECAYRICLWSRSVSRVLLPIFTHSIDTSAQKKERDVAEELYSAAQAFDWTLTFSPLVSMAVRLHTDRNIVVNNQYATLRVKDGIVDAFNEITGSRPSINPKEPDIIITVFAGVFEHKFCIDLSGDSLHKRGYRVAMTGAPLKENLAATIVYKSGFADALKTDNKPKVLIDPMCGSGTLLIEAMLMYIDCAPQLTKRFGFLDWKGHRNDIWQNLLTEAKERLNIGMQQQMPQIYAFDADMDALYAAEENWIAAGLESLLPNIRFENRMLGDWDNLPNYPTSVAASDIWLITNPPYGERLGSKTANKALYQGLNLFLQKYFTGGHATVLAAQIETADVLSLQDPTTLRLTNGNLPIYARSGTILPGKPANSFLTEWQPANIELELAQDFANRLQKNMINCKKIALKNNVSCMRIYDADLPDFNIAVDLYGGNAHVQEYAPPKTIDPEKAKMRFSNALHAIRQVLGLSKQQVFIKTRARQTGTTQYERKTDAPTKRFIVQEGNCHFLVNLSDYLDTGLFLDHRPMRLKVAAYSAGKNILNLFSYTSSVAVHAAVNGAASTTNVDLSNTYLEWSTENYALNGIAIDNNQRHRFIASDVFGWIKDCENTFDLIFLDPPTFSNSKKFFGTFDVQRDHMALIKLTMECLSPDGVLLFSNNNRKFTLDETLFNRFNIIDITEESIDFDFKRNTHIHKAWEIRHKD